MGDARDSQYLQSISWQHLHESSGAFLDVFYELVLKYTGDVKKSKKILKDMIKISVKIGLLYRHNQFSEAELGTRLHPSCPITFVLPTL